MNEESKPVGGYGAPQEPRRERNLMVGPAPASEKASRKD